MNSRIKKVLAVVLSVMMLFGSFAMGASADEVKRISCTMVEDGSSGRGFSWYTYEDGASDLQIVKTEEFDGTFKNAKLYEGSTAKFRQQYVHKVYVNDLEAGTSYTYRVGDAEKDLWGETCSVITDDGDDSFSFITIADVQASSDENFAQASLTLKGALEVAPEAEFIATLGDYVNDNTNDEWDWYFKNFAFANNYYTHVPVAGNHDGNITNKFNTNCFKNMFALDESDNQSLEGVYYSFDYGNAHIAVLNTNDIYPMSQAQRNWLINDMKQSDATWKIILMHRALYSAGKHFNKPDTIMMRNILLPLFDELNIDMVYAGHDHMYLRTTQVYGDAAVEGTTYIEEIIDGKTTKIAVDPEGTVYVLPATAGTKRYNLNDDATNPALDVADKAFSTSDWGGCFCVTEIEGGKLVYKAYLVDDETQKIELIDTYAIMKTEGNTSEESNLDESFMASVMNYPANLFKAIMEMLVSYFKMLFDLIAG
ncbi:MAG: metallophosphoesterase family protein [Clostridia bacterium]|nr:metallophosphoesterase family protein [Clostridia bacterium]